MRGEPDTRQLRSTNPQLVQVSCGHLALVKNTRNDHIARIVDTKRNEMPWPTNGRLRLRFRARLQVIDEIPRPNVVDRAHTGATRIRRKILEGAIEQTTVTLAGTPAEILTTASQRIGDIASGWPRDADALHLAARRLRTLLVVDLIKRTRTEVVEISRRSSGFRFVEGAA